MATRLQSREMGADRVLSLYDRHARELLGFFTRRTRDPHLALDLLSETFLAAFEHRHQCRAESDGEAASWLYRIAANQLAAHYRRGAIERRATERFVAQLRAPTADELSAIERLAEAEEGGALTEALAGLSEDQRIAVRARVLDEHSYEAVSRELGVSQQAARARVSRGLRALRRAAAGDAGRSHDGQA
ncbi:MAG TPA: sigma-70 family RNA polymerase sigma factor [Solirubrobacteraceae bacterium]|nr:sigma-70 family RNA polymerase sigma factor [Solirubrobacteraceae bacterium]